MTAPPARLAGIAWYRADAYARVVALMVDGASFPKTHPSWRQKAGRMERELRRQGMTPVRVELDPEAFGAWCRVHRIPPDSDARSHYLEERVGRHGLDAADRSTPTDASRP